MCRDATMATTILFHPDTPMIPQTDAKSNVGLRLTIAIVLQTANGENRLAGWRLRI
jgi:hypothetical protein